MGMTWQERLRDKAYHEAGHAVAALALGFKVYGAIVTVEQDQEGAIVVSGHTLHEPPTEATRDIDTVRKCVVQLLAGGAAESIVFGKAGSDEAQQDWMKAVLYLLVEWGVGPSEDGSVSVDPGTTQKAMDEVFVLQGKCRELLEEHREALVRIAEQLLQQRNRQVPGQQMPL